MRFADCHGNENVLKTLSSMVDSGRIPHAIMFHENDGGGAIAVCLAFLQYINCRERSGGDSCGVCPQCSKTSRMIHPDVHYVFPAAGGSGVSSGSKSASLSYIGEWRSLVGSNPFFTEEELGEALGTEGKNTLISVAESKAILDKLAFNSLEGGYRSVVIYLPEKMNQEAANRLLKSIEEPPQKTIFLLITHAPEKVLSTISSRCQRMRLMPVPHVPEKSETVVLYGDLFRSLMDSLTKRDLLSALETGEALAALPSREKTRGFCRYASECMRWIFLLQQGMESLCTFEKEEDAGYFISLASQLKKTFARLALANLDRAAMLLERNGNAKIVFCDLVNKLFLIV